MGAVNFDYPGASGQSFLVFDRYANSDTVVLIGKDLRYYTSLHLGAKYGASAFPGPMTWDMVRLEGIPVGDTLSIRFSGDASLASLLCEGGDLTPAFNPSDFHYTIELAPDTITTPVVAAVSADSHAVMTIDPAADILSDYEPDRTTVVSVVAEDGISTADYSILFSVSTAGILNTPRPVFMIWPNPASDIVTVKHNKPFTRIEVTSLSGQTLVVRKTGRIEAYSLDESTLAKGVYFIRIFNKNDFIGSVELIKR